MRIALVAPLVAPIREPNLGGAQVVVADLARGLIGRGHDVVVYAASDSVIEGVDVASLGIDSSDLAGDRFRPGEEPQATEAMLSAYEAVYADIVARGFDVVHNHGFDAPAISVAARRGVGVLHTLHLPPSPHVAAALNAARGRAPLWCAGVSTAQSSGWGYLTPVDTVLRNGVPVERISVAERAGAAAVIAARFSVEKGIDQGITAARGASMPVDVYGTPYDDAHEAAIRDRWRDDVLVRFHHPVPRAVLWEVLSVAMVAICLSQWTEPFGMVAAEAQAAGTPVVASASGGLPEVVRDGVTGFLVEAGDSRAAADAVARVGEIDRAECRRHAVGSLSLDAAVSAHEAMYSRITAS